MYVKKILSSHTINIFFRVMQFIKDRLVIRWIKEERRKGSRGLKQPIKHRVSRNLAILMQLPTKAEKPRFS